MRARGGGREAFTLIELPAVRQRKREAFTLIELLVVIAIISLLASILVPALRMAKQLAVVATCATTQRSAFLALNTYATEEEEYPATGDKAAHIGGTWSDSQGNPGYINEKDGFGFGAFTSAGPYRLLYDGKYISNWRQLQCTIDPSFPPYGGRHGFVPGPSADRGLAYWYGYNGPHAWGPRVGNYGHNGGIYVLGGHHIWVTGSWGLSYREDDHRCWNGYRSGRVTVAEVAFLACPAIGEAGSGGWPVADREPHMEHPAGIRDSYGFTWFQTGGPLWDSPYNWRLRRNYVFGDGHCVFISRDDQAFDEHDRF